MRSRLRERRRTEERSKAARQEEREKAGEGRLERNKRWRQRKETHHSSSSTISTSSSLKELVDNQEEEEKQSRRREPSERRQDEKESRREKNREWRRKRSGGWDETSGEKKAENQSKLCEILQAVLACSDCGLVSFIVLSTFVIGLTFRNWERHLAEEVMFFVKVVQQRWVGHLEARAV